MIAWCFVVDIEPPIEVVGGRVVSLDRAQGTMVVEWEVLKNRHCQGRRANWIRDDGPEPPPHDLIYLGEDDLAPEGFSGHSRIRGEAFRFRVTIKGIPAGIEDQFVYKAEWRYSCNFVQTVWPLRVQSPFIQVRPQG